ncbi:hypothetical protein F4553_003396 [Allocatelliglobosispora scoriae]|uniref:DUF998 domain-containing protein n=1 Tax=Allocatelliglobosispora scoriae TaxID=643052 RepID=A0A841BLQ5_9ACTN|nr:hypothetical protein [Allocatelliglobosispora scoriae]MBB5870017.1 hypothetical protein [Allocatelliglobosispora scoriae]
MSRLNERIFMVFSGLLMIAGTLIGMYGGEHHPLIGPHMGKYGSDEFFYKFAHLMVDDPNWQNAHWQILVGPVLWFAGALSLVIIARAAGERRWTLLGFVSLTVGAVLYVVTYINDGFVSPHIGEALIAATDKGDVTLAAAITQTFAALQWVTIKISLPGWLLLAFSTACLSIGVWAAARTYRGLLKLVAYLTAVTGVFFGVWSFVAVAAGSYSPGPMVSPWWIPSLYATNFWYLLAGLIVVVHGFSKRIEQTHEI